VVYPERLRDRPDDALATCRGKRRQGANSCKEISLWKINNWVFKKSPSFKERGFFLF